MSKEEKNNLENASKEFNDGVGHFKLSIWVPTEAVGKVIGKKGAVIQHIQRETKTTCSIISAPTGDSESLEGPRWSPIVIMGDPSRTLAAHDMIHDIVEEIDDAIVEFSLPSHLIPRHFQSYSKYYPTEAIQLLSAETSVRIHIPDKRENPNTYKSRDRDSHYNSSDMLISLEGEVSNIFKAITSFAVAVGSRNTFKNMKIPQPDTGCRFIGEDEGKSDRNSKADKDNWRKRDKENEDDDLPPNYEQYVNIPSNLVGLLLARRDSDLSVMKQIQRGSRTNITKLPEPVIPISTEGREQPEIVEGDIDKVVAEDEKTDKLYDDKCKNSRKNSDRLVETFCVRGCNASSVELAASCLLRIVNGEMISHVLSSMNTHKNRSYKGNYFDVSKSIKPISVKTSDIKKQGDTNNTEEFVAEVTKDNVDGKGNDEYENGDKEGTSTGKGIRIAGRGGGRGKSRGRGRGFGSKGSGKSGS